MEFERDVDRRRVETPSASTAHGRQLRMAQRKGRSSGGRRACSIHPAYNLRRRDSLGGDTIVPHEWIFRTHDPPVFVEIKGRDQAPTVLEAIPSGGLGNFAIQWNTGQTDRKIIFPGPGAAPHQSKSPSAAATAR